jgi:hypothetical protein
MPTYTAQATVTGEVVLDTGTNDLEESFHIVGDVLKDGQPIGSFDRRFGPQTPNQEIRIELLGAIRDIVEQDIVDTAQAALDQRAQAIEDAINTWEKIL